VFTEKQPQSGCIKICSELTKEPIEFKSIDDTAASPLAQELFKFSYVKEVLSMKTIFVTNMKSTTGKK
jgi:hypothetical protein